MQASRYATLGRRKWRSMWKPNIRDNTPEGAAARAELTRVADIEQRKSNEMIGAELGYHYFGSPLVWPEEGEGPKYDYVDYFPSTWPGVRLPHTWLDDGMAMQDRIGFDRGFTLLRLGKSQADVSALEKAFAVLSRAVPHARHSRRRAARGLWLRSHPAASGHARRLARQPSAGRCREARGDRDGALSFDSVKIPSLRQHLGCMLAPQCDCCEGRLVLRHSHERIAGARMSEAIRICRDVEHVGGATASVIAGDILVQVAQQRRQVLEPIARRCG